MAKLVHKTPADALNGPTRKKRYLPKYYWWKTATIISWTVTVIALIELWYNLK